MLSPDEVAHARAVLAASDATAVGVLPSGAMVDQAMRRSAEEALALDATTSRRTRA